MTTRNGFAVANVRDLPLAANSVDLIFADPPYLRESLSTYGWLADEAMRVLKPGGFLLAYCGGYFINQIFRMFDAAGLEFYWEFAEYYPSSSVTMVHRRKVLAKHKVILAYSRGPGHVRVAGVHSIFTPTGNMKGFHHWGQAVGTARYYIDHFSKPGDIVLDPFLGGGSTAVACALIGRHCLGFDLDTAAVSTTIERLNHPDHAPVTALPLFASIAL